MPMRATGRGSVQEYPQGYFRNSNKIPLEEGDIVAVEATPGHDIGVVTLTGRLVPLTNEKAKYQV